MRTIKFIFIVFSVWCSTMTVHAATWYDRLPANGDVAPKANNGDVQPNVNGNTNYTAPNQLNFSADDAGTPPPTTPHTMEALHDDVSKLAHAKALTSKKLLWPVVVVSIVSIAGIVYFALQKPGKNK